MKRYRSISLMLAAIAIVGLALRYAPHIRHRADAGSIPDLLEFVPADSTIFGYADVAALRDSPLMQRLAALARPAKVDQDYADFVRVTGFDYQKDLDRVVFAWRPGPPMQTFVLAEGRFDHARIERYALQAGKLENQDGHPVYVTPGSAPGKNVSIAFLAGNRIALSDGSDLRAAFAPAQQSQLDSAFRERVSRVAGAPVFAIAKAAGFVAGNAAAAGPSAIASPFASLRWVSVAARPEGGGVLVSADGECVNPGDAQKMASSVEFVRGMLNGGVSNPKSRGQMTPETAAAVEHLLQGVRITTEEDRVRLLLVITPEMFSLSAPAAGAQRTPAGP